jgi:uncharacterized 2Fe-2S/4Fe-4S cluster protein (DUF4445 family)
VQLAKSAIRTGLDLLLADAGLGNQDLSCIILAGAFGKFLTVEDAVTVGLIPPIEREKIVQVGNAAGAGVRRTLTDLESRAEARKLAEEGQYLELASNPAFDRAFARNAMFHKLT